MEIIITNNLSFYVLVFLIVPILVLKGFNFNKGGYNKDLLNKNNTNTLKGLSVLVVIFCHIGMFSVNKNIIYTILTNLGGIAVAVFLFVSGYGLASQYYQRNNYLKGFFAGKIFKLYLVFFISNIIVTIINNVFLETKYTFTDVLKSSLVLRFSDGRELWFVAAILFFYIVFYFSFKLLKDKKAILAICFSPIIYIVLCILLDRGPWWYNTAFCFPLGVVFADQKWKIISFFNRNYFSLLLLSSFGTIVSFLAYLKGVSILQFVTPIIFILLVTLTFMKSNLNSISMFFINKISFEIYLIHLVVLKVIFYDGIAKDSIYLVLVFPITILLSIVIHWMINQVYKIGEQCTVLLEKS